MTLIVKTVTRITLGFILLYGVYIALCGHVGPGGGFAGGVIVALSFVHVMLAFGKEVALKRLNANVLRLVVGLGALAFLFVVMTGFTKGCEIIIPLAETMIVGFGLFAIFIAMALLARADKNSE